MHRLLEKMGPCHVQVVTKLHTSMPVNCESRKSHQSDASCGVCHVCVCKAALALGAKRPLQMPKFLPRKKTAVAAANGGATLTVLEYCADGSFVSESFEAGLVCYAVHMVHADKRSLTYQFENMLVGHLNKRKNDEAIGVFGASITDLAARMHVWAGGELSLTRVSFVFLIPHC